MKRKPLLTLIAGILLVGAGFSSCGETPGVVDETITLKVEPSSTISFEAKDNDDVILTVTTNAESWDVEKPDWVTADKNGDKLTVNVNDNAGEFRNDRIKVTAGDKTVEIGVSQKKGEGDDLIDPDKVAVSLIDDAEQDNKAIHFTVKADSPAQSTVYLSSNAAPEAAVTAKVVVDADYVETYNFLNETDCELFPSELLTIGNSGNATIAAGSTKSNEITVGMAFDDNALEFGVTYLIPLLVEVTSENGQAARGESARVYYTVSKVSARKSVRNICWMEINDANPLNLLEYKLETGELFFDAIVLFSSNINYNRAEDRVFISNNPNNQALFDEAATYLKPLQDAGIKVYLSLLGNHDPAGVAQLAPQGASDFALETAETVKRYNLAGVAYDDEYSAAPETSNTYWFTSKGPGAASDLLSKTKIAMKEVCGEDRDVVIFEWGSIYATSLQTANGLTPNEYVDVVNANYGGRGGALPSQPSGDRSKQSYTSIELNRGYSTGATTAAAQEAKAQGYGWCMWFALNAGYTGGKGYTMAAYEGDLSLIKAVCLGLYDVPLVTPTHYYKKGTQDGVYDPVRYAY